MADLKTLRWLIIFSYFFTLLFTMTSVYFDPTLGEPMIAESNHLISSAMINSVAFNVVFMLTLLTLAYSSAALWFGYISGKWTFILFIILDLSIPYFTKVMALSWLGNILLSLYMLVLGMIFAILFLSPLKEELRRPKPFRFWAVFGMFILFFIIILFPASAITPSPLPPIAPEATQA